MESIPLCGVQGKKKPATRAGFISDIHLFLRAAFLALSATVLIADFAVSATALMVESTLEAVESTTFFALSTTVETAESVLAAASLLSTTA